MSDDMAAKNLTGFTGFVFQLENNYYECGEPLEIRVLKDLGGLLWVEPISGERKSIPREDFTPRYIRMATK